MLVVIAQYAQKAFLEGAEAYIDSAINSPAVVDRACTTAEGPLGYRCLPCARSFLCFFSPCVLSRIAFIRREMVPTRHTVAS